MVKNRIFCQFLCVTNRRTDGRKRYILSTGEGHVMRQNIRKLCHDGDWIAIGWVWCQVRQRAQGRGLSGVLRDQVTIDIEHVRSVRQVNHVRYVVVSSFRDDEISHISHQRIDTLLSTVTHTYTSMTSFTWIDKSVLFTAARLATTTKDNQYCINLTVWLKCFQV